MNYHNVALPLLVAQPNGIDTVSHLYSYNQLGKTIAVLGNGFEHIFPEENIKLLKDFSIYIQSLKKPIDNPQEAESEIETFADFHGVKPKVLFMPLRYVLLGKSGGVGIAPLLASLEKEEIIKRIQNALESFKG